MKYKLRFGEIIIRGYKRYNVKICESLIMNINDIVLSVLKINYVLNGNL